MTPHTGVGKDDIAGLHRKGTLVAIQKLTLVQVVRMEVQKTGKRLSL
jgi:hypothetical protein